MPSRRQVRRMIAAALREAGVLMLAFAPLDGAFNRGAGLRRIVTGFIVLGVVLFAVGVVTEGDASHVQ